jgi:hypothetical protein
MMLWDIVGILGRENELSPKFHLYHFVLPIFM